jgi:hypothetical protein
MAAQLEHLDTRLDPHAAIRRLLIGLVVALVAGIVGVAPAAAQAPATFPESIPLPDGFYPEGIAVGYGNAFFVGSLLDGALYKGDLRTGEGDVLAPGVEGRLVAGLSFDQRSGLVWGAGFEGGAGSLLIFDGETGETVDTVPIPGAFLNDLVVTRSAVYVTDSLTDQLWTVPVTNRGLPSGPPTSVTLSGDFQFVTEGELPINLNGIDATPNGKTVIAVHTTLGVLYRINTATGEATEIDLGGQTLDTADGILLHGRTVYVVQNFLNQVAVVEVSPDFSQGQVVDLITSDLFRVPTTVARAGNSLYLVNARFDAAFPPFFDADPVSIDYDVVRVSR